MQSPGTAGPEGPRTHSESIITEQWFWARRHFLVFLLSCKTEASGIQHHLSSRDTGANRTSIMPAPDRCQRRATGRITPQHLVSLQGEVLWNLYFYLVPLSLSLSSRFIFNYVNIHVDTGIRVQVPPEARRGRCITRAAHSAEHPAPPPIIKSKN